MSVSWWWLICSWCLSGISLLFIIDLFFKLLKVFVLRPMLQHWKSKEVWLLVMIFLDKFKFIDLCNEWIFAIYAEFVIYDYEATRHCDLMQFTESLKSQLLVFGKSFTRQRIKIYLFSQSICLWWTLVLWIRIWFSNSKHMWLYLFSTLYHNYVWSLVNPNPFMD